MAIAIVVAGSRPAAASAAHPLHTTLTQLAIDPRDRSLVVTVRVFADDLGTVVGKFAGVMPGPAHEVPDAAIARYVASRLTLETTAGRASLAWVSAKRTGDVVWITLRAPAGTSLDRARVGNGMLCELYADQVNIVQVQWAGRSRSVLLMRGDGAKAI